MLFRSNEKALLMHEKWNGKLETVSKTPVKTREDLAIAYTPGVAEPCKVKMCIRDSFNSANAFALFWI